MSGLNYDQLVDVYEAAERLVQAWPHESILGTARLIGDLRRALGYHGENGRVMQLVTPPEEMYEGATCSLAGG